MTIWPAAPTAPINESQLIRTREVTAAFEYAARHPHTAQLEEVIKHYLQIFAPAATGLHRAALRAAFKRGYTLKNGK